MRWSYKTVHYELTKEGLLGSAFLDESAVELSLNEYGKAGWELVSMLETVDGLIAIFKQPLGLDNSPDFFVDSEKRIDDEIKNRATEEVTDIGEKPPERFSVDEIFEEDVSLLDDFEVVEEVDKSQGDFKSPEKSDVGAIRIE